jgi:D-lactate dehydrogenase (cytochrome)
MATRRLLLRARGPAAAACAVAAGAAAALALRTAACGAPPPPPPPPPAPPTTAALVDGLRAIVGAEHVLTDADETAAYGRDQYSPHGGPGPLVVALPASTHEVAAVVRLCAALGAPLVSRGAGTSLEGHTTTPRRGSCVLDLSRLDRVLAVRPADMDCTVQAGVTWGNLNEALAPLRLFLTADPGPGATVGGMMATGCSGTNALRYGTMRACVLSATVVLADGSVVSTGTRARKTSAGYDLTGLFCGQEGTLGVVTELHLRLQPLPEATGVAVCAFPDVAAACRAVNGVLRAGVQLGAAELLDARMVSAVNAAAGGGGGGGGGGPGGAGAPPLLQPDAPHVLFKLTGSRAKVRDDAAAVRRIALGGADGGGGGDAGSGGGGGDDAGGRWRWSDDPEGQARLWHARKVALWSVQALEGAGGGGGGRARQVATTDVCVPLSALPALMADMEAHVAAGCLRGHVYAVAHAGDGNAHHFIAFDPADAAEAAEAARLGRALVTAALARGGTCTGEHGVGVGKRGYLPLEYGQPAVDVMHALKRALDPRGVLNPGKKLPDAEPPGGRRGGGEGGGGGALGAVGALRFDGGPPCS